MSRGLFWVYPYIFAVVKRIFLSKIYPKVKTLIVRLQINQAEPSANAVAADGGWERLETVSNLGARVSQTTTGKRVFDIFRTNTKNPEVLTGQKRRPDEGCERNPPKRRSPYRLHISCEITDSQYRGVPGNDTTITAIVKASNCLQRSTLINFYQTHRGGSTEVCKIHDCRRG